MAVMITESCINCLSCIDECPATAIVSADENPIKFAEYLYVKPEKCIECVDSSVPKCVDVCPTEGAIVWDMPYIELYDDYYMQGHNEGRYSIRIHQKKGIFSPKNSPKPFRENISIEDRAEHQPISI
jgi:Fe-S-cluster-containing dehydrogenase component